MSRALTAADAARAALAARERGEAVALATLVEAPAGSDAGRPALLAPGARLIVDEAGGSAGTLGDEELDAAVRERASAMFERADAGGETVELDVAGSRCRVYLETQRPPDELLVVGAGHIAVPLAAVGATLGFRVTVLDDREEFATEARFPDAARVLRTDFAGEPFREVRVGRRTYVVLVTRAHRYDFDCLRLLLERDPAPAYIGMIGSRRRVRAAFHALLEGGVPRERLERVRAPVGIEIGAETPEEIAVSIAAEMVAVRRGVTAPGSISGDERVLERFFGAAEPSGPDSGRARARAAPGPGRGNGPRA